MGCDITRSEAVIFAVAIHKAIEEAKPMLPNIVIMNIGAKIDFKANDIPGQIQRLLADLKASDPVVTTTPVETRRSRIDDKR